MNMCPASAALIPQVGYGASPDSSVLSRGSTATLSIATALSRPFGGRTHFPGIIVNTNTQTIRASVAEGEFFQNIKHLFSGSLIFLSELMQNARRAGATRIEINYDQETKTLSMHDDGCGITDFAVLLCFSKSGWEHKIAQRDRPFGMGVFSLFHVAQHVTFQSHGQRLAVTLDDVVQSRELSVQADSTAPTTGTLVVLAGLHDRQSQLETLHGHLKRLAKGFPIPVFFNGEALPQPHVELALQTIVTEVGTVTFGPKHEGVGERHGEIYLQGLPLGESRRTFPIVHLNSTRFSAVMPDRQRLYDHEESIAIIQKAVDAAGRTYILQQRQQMSDAEFVQFFWTKAKGIGELDSLLNGVNMVPCSLFGKVDEVKTQHAVDYLYGQNHFTREQIETGEVKAWINGPSRSNENALAPVLMQIALDHRIFTVDEHQLPEGHWLLDALPAVDDLDISWTINEVGNSLHVATERSEVKAVGCTSIDVRLVGRGDSQFTFNCRIDEAPVVLPLSQELTTAELLSNELDEEESIVYVPTNVQGTPEQVFSDFSDEYDRVNEDLHETCKEGWRDAYAILAGSASLKASVETAFSRGSVRLPLNSEMVVVRSRAYWSNYMAQWGEPSMAVEAMDDALLQRVAARLPGVSASALFQAFADVLAPGVQIVEDDEAAIVQAAHAWVCTINGTFHVMNSNNFQAPLDIVEVQGKKNPGNAEACKLIQSITAQKLGMALDQFAALPVPERATLVRRVWGRL